MILNRELFISDIKRFQRFCSGDDLAEKIAEYIHDYYYPKKEIQHKVKFEKVIEVVCDYFKVDAEKVFKKTRAREFVAIRRICMYLLYTRTTMTNSEIGKMMGRRDHSTVIHSRNKMQDLMDVYPEVRQEVEYLNSQL